MWWIVETLVVAAVTGLISANTDAEAVRITRKAEKHIARKRWEYAAAGARLEGADAELGRSRARGSATSRRLDREIGD